MPKRPSGIPAETQRERFARRLDEEAERRGWSDAALAHRASEHRDSECVAGCHHYPMSASTIWKIKSEKQARGVSIDEATALAVGAFGYASIEAFLQDSPLEALRSQMRQLSENLELQMHLAGKAREMTAEVAASLEDPAVRQAMASGREAEARTIAEWADTLATVWDASVTLSRTVAESWRLAVDRMAQEGAEDVQ